MNNTESLAKTLVEMRIKGESIHDGYIERIVLAYARFGNDSLTTKLVLIAMFESGTISAERIKGINLTSPGLIKSEIFNDITTKKFMEHEVMDYVRPVYSEPGEE